MYAASPYVLPYPSAMPGSTFYKIHGILEKLLQYWYFGNFGQFEYNLKQSDKYLVQAKTLFEYQQYLLGYNALLKSDDFFKKIKPYLLRAKHEGKDISQKEIILKQAALKHVEVLEKMQQDTPQSFVWQPEKASATQLNLRDALSRSENIRTESL